MTMLQIWMWITRPFDWRKFQRGFTLLHEVMMLTIIVVGLVGGIVACAYLIPRCV